jgi:hypothetical protein
MSEVKRSTEHSMELKGITIKIDKPDGDIISIHTKEPTYSNYMRLRVEDMPTLRVALQDFQNWLETQESK